jgi:hypothetical protein
MLGSVQNLNGQYLAFLVIIDDNALSYLVALGYTAFPQDEAQSIGAASNRA